MGGGEVYLISSRGVGLKKGLGNEPQAKLKNCERSIHATRLRWRSHVIQKGETLQSAIIILFQMSPSLSAWPTSTFLLRASMIVAAKDQRAPNSEKTIKLLKTKKA